MASDKCPFCGSTKMVIDTPYIDRFGDKITTYCCAAQDKNQKYLKAHINPWKPFDDQFSTKDPSKI